MLSFADRGAVVDGGAALRLAVVVELGRAFG
jgi:hypothetical protein